MKVISVNVGVTRDVTIEGRAAVTAIDKRPVDGPVAVGTLGLEGDEIGPRDKGHAIHAVYAYPVEHYAYWERELGLENLPMGQFGENLTVSGLTEEEVRVGDIFRFGTALLLATSPRIPCYKLADRMNQGKDFPLRFLASRRTGIYFEVLQEGRVGPGDAVERVEHDPDAATIAEFVRVTEFETGDVEGLERLLNSRHLAPSWKEQVGEMAEDARSGKAGSGWKGFRTLVLDRRVKESETVTSFYLVPEDCRPLPTYKPGQFLTVALDIPGREKPVIRTYTLSDSPNHEDYYRLTIKREPAAGPDLPAGVASNYFHDQVQPGTHIRAKAPMGEFHLDRESTRPVALLSGGVGLTPMISMLNALVEGGPERPVWFIHGVRNGSEHALGDHVRGLADACANVRAHVVYQDPGAGDVKGRDYDSEGFITTELLNGLLPSTDMDFYLCGPPPFMKAVYNLLLDWGASEDRIRYEFFGPATVLKATLHEDGAEKAAPVKRAESADGVSVTFAKSGKTVNWNGSANSILDLAEDAGLTPAFSCRSGLCLTCMTVLVEGEVHYPEEPAATPSEGSVLLCCSIPKSDVTIDI